MKSRLITAGTIISTVAFVAFSTLWVNSFSGRMPIGVPLSHSAYLMQVSGSTAIIWQNPDRRLQIYKKRPKQISQVYFVVGDAFKFVDPVDSLAFGYPAKTAMVEAITIRNWFLAPLFAITPLLWSIRYRKRRLIERRQLHGQCLACGFDLRASKDRCPECGSPILII